MTKPQLPNLQQTVANTILITNISFFRRRKTLSSCCDIIKQLVSFKAIKFTKQESVSQSVSE